MQKPYYYNLVNKEIWHKKSDSLFAKIQEYFKALGVDAEERINQVKNQWKNKIDSKLRKKFQMTRRMKEKKETTSNNDDHPNIENSKLKIHISNKIPPPVIEILKKLSSAELWVLLHMDFLKNTSFLLDKINSKEFLLNTIINYFPKKEIETVKSFLHIIDSKAISSADEALNEILKCQADVLGAYFIDYGSIELYWVVIWLTSKRLNCQVEDLSIVILIHEMAHLYSHRGYDADSNRWETTRFKDTDTKIIEGIAQFYTNEICLQIANDDFFKPLEIFKKLKDCQSDDYKCYQEWISSNNNKKRLEIIRYSIIRSRSRDNLKYKEFIDLVHEGDKNLFK